jgi:hypothetical protein
VYDFLKAQNGCIRTQADYNHVLVIFATSKIRIAFLDLAVRPAPPCPALPCIPSALAHAARPPTTCHSRHGASNASSLSAD